MLFDGLDLCEPKAQTKCKGCLAPLSGEAAMLRSKGAKTTSSSQGVANSPRKIYGKKGEDYVSDGEDGHVEMRREKSRVEEQDCWRGT